MSRKQINQCYRSEMLFASMAVAAAWVGGFIFIAELLLK